MVGGGFTGLWTALLAKTGRPAARRPGLLEAREIGWAGVRSQRRVLRGQPDPRPGQRGGPVPGGDGRRSSGSAGATSTRSKRPWPGWASTAISSAPVSSTVATAPHQVAWLAEEAELARRFGHDVAELDRAAVRRGWRSPTYLAGATGPGTAPRWSTRPGWPGGCARPAVAGRAASPSTRPSPRLRARRRRASAAHRARRRCAPGRSPWPPTASPALLRRMRPYVVPVYDYVLVTEPLTARPAGADRLAAPPGRQRRRQPVPLLPADRRQPHPLGRLRRDLPLAQRAARRARPAAGDVRPRWPSTSSPTFPQLGGRPVPAPVGRGDRHVDPVLRLPAARRWAGGWPTASVTPVWASGRPGSGPRSMLDLLDGRDTEATRLRASATPPVPFPPEPLRWAGITLTRRAMARADRARAAADRGCGLSTGSGSVSTPEPPVSARCWRGPRNDRAVRRRSTGRTSPSSALTACDWAEPVDLCRCRRRHPGRAVRRRHLAPARAPASARSTSGRAATCRTTGPGRRWRCGVDGLRDLRVLDAGDVEMFSGDAERSVRDLQEAVHTVAATGAIPLILGGDHTIAWPDAAGRRPAPRPGPDLDDPLRRARRHRRHRIRLAHRARSADAPADRVRCRARRPVPADRPARVLAGAGRRWTGWPSSACAPTR